VAIRIIEYVHWCHGRPYRTQEENEENEEEEKEEEEDDEKKEDDNKWATKRKEEVKEWTSLYLNDAWQE
jgi:uncharacterized Zn finger protein (UPF0148 family)